MALKRHGLFHSTFTKSKLFVFVQTKHCVTTNVASLYQSSKCQCTMFCMALWHWLLLEQKMPVLATNQCLRDSFPPKIRTLNTYASYQMSSNTFNARINISFWKDYIYISLTYYKVLFKFSRCLNCINIV